MAALRDTMRRTVLAFLVCLVPASSPAQVVYEGDSTYYHIEVVDEPVTGSTVRRLFLDGNEHSAVDLKYPSRPVWAYTDYVHLAWIFNDHPGRALVLGLGGGVIPMKFYRDYPDLKTDVVEIDPLVKQTAKEYFDVKEDDRLKIHVSGGREFLNHTGGVFDLIVTDVFRHGRYGDTLPFNYCTREFFESARNKLSPDGLLVFNLIGRIEGRAQLSRSIIRTVRTVFPNVYLFLVDLQKYPRLTEERNIIMVCSQDKTPLSTQEIMKRAVRLTGDRKVHVAGFTEYARDLYGGTLDREDAVILTDEISQPDRF